MLIKHGSEGKYTVTQRHWMQLLMLECLSSHKLLSIIVFSKGDSALIQQQWTWRSRLLKNHLVRINNSERLLSTCLQASGLQQGHCNVILRRQCFPLLSSIVCVLLFLFLCLCQCCCSGRVTYLVSCWLIADSPHLRSLHTCHPATHRASGQLIPSPERFLLFLSIN